MFERNSAPNTATTTCRYTFGGITLCASLWRVPIYAARVGTLKAHRKSPAAAARPFWTLRVNYNWAHRFMLRRFFWSVCPRYAHDVWSSAACSLMMLIIIILCYNVIYGFSCDYIINIRPQCYGCGGRVSCRDELRCSAKRLPRDEDSACKLFTPLQLQVEQIRMESLQSPNDNI